MKINARKLLGGASVVALALTFPAPRLRAATDIDPDADRIFRAACKYLAQSKAFSVKVDVWKDVLLPTGAKLQTTRTLQVHEQRPDQLRVEVRSPRQSRGFWYHEKALTMLDRSMNLYAVMDVPGTIDETIDAVEDRFGIEIPIGDVLVADPYANMMENMQSAQDLGKVTILGVVCDHLAFIGTNVDCQIWIADGARPLPKKIVINFKTKIGSPQLTQLFSDWDLVNPVSDSTFTFTPPDGALKIVVNPRISDDELEDAETASATGGESGKYAAKK